MMNQHQNDVGCLTTKIGVDPIQPLNTIAMTKIRIRSLDPIQIGQLAQILPYVVRVFAFLSPI
jgi:hypothetical protein